MAGSWEPLFFRVRRDGGKDYVPTPQQRAAYEREHNAEMIARLKALGVNFVMMHGYKGAGLEAERESMADAVRFAKLYRKNGLHVGAYIDSGTVLWELLYKEKPSARDWSILDSHGKPFPYPGTLYRYWRDRNNPEAAAYYRQVVRFAVEDMKLDLLHFDNFIIGPGTEANSIRRFRRYLANAFTPKTLAKMGISQLDTVQAPTDGSPELLQYAWRDFCCRSLADSYREMSEYARSLRPDILVECNPQGPGEWIGPPVDHGRLLRSGEAFWDETGHHVGFHDGKLKTNIRAYKIARCMDNIAFRYVRTPLQMAESMAFNLDCLGCICWFENAKINNYPGWRGKPIDPETAPFVRFFHQRREWLRDARVMADVAVLRSFPSQVFAPPRSRKLTSKVEQALIENRGCFQIIYDHQLADLDRYRVLALAGCVAMSDEQIDQIKRYVARGGRLCVIGPLATHDKWMQPRKKAALDDLPGQSVVRIAADDDPLAAIQQACENKLSLSIRAKRAEKPLLGLCAELTEQPGKRLVHLINYRTGEPFEEVRVDLRVPAGRQTTGVLLASPQRMHDLTIPFEQEGDIVTFNVPAVAVYEIAAVTIK